MRYVPCLWAWHWHLLFLWGRALDARLIHQIRNALLQIIDAIAHIIDACDDLIRHRLEFILYVLQEILYLIDNTAHTHAHARRDGEWVGGRRGAAACCCIYCYLVVAFALLT